MEQEEGPGGGVEKNEIYVQCVYPFPQLQGVFGWRKEVWPMTEERVCRRGGGEYGRCDLVQSARFDQTAKKSRASALRSSPSFLSSCSSSASESRRQRMRDILCGVPAEEISLYNLD